MIRSSPIKVWTTPPIAELARVLAWHPGPMGSQCNGGHPIRIGEGPGRESQGDSSVPKRLAVRLISSLTAMVVIVEGAFGYINVKTQERQLLDNMILGADQLSRSITSATWHSMLADRRATAYEVMQTIATKQGIDQIRIFNKEGKVTFSTSGKGASQVDKRAEACTLCHADAQPLVRVDVPSRARIFRMADGVRRLGMVTPIYNEVACSQTACHAHPAGKNVLGVLDVTLTLDRVDQEVAALRLRTFVGVALEIALIILFIVLLTRRFAVVPVRKLMEGTRAVSNMDLDQPIEVDDEGGLGDLARAFNEMRERLKKAVADLNELTKSLEARVEHRTRQLEAAQKKLVQNARLASLGQLSATVAHEINNPLSGVLNLSVLMQRILKDDGIPPHRIAEFKGYLVQVTAETTRIARIVSDLLAFSRQKRPGGTSADLNGVVQSTLAVVGYKLEMAGVRVELDLAADLPPVNGDGSQLRQVVLNLVMNGAESMPRGGVLRINTRVKTDGCGVLLEVQDTGVGIPETVLPNIFDPFFTTKGEGQGVGLGLAVVYGIVDAHRGELEVASEEGKGTTFRITLPAFSERATGGSSRGGEDS